MRARILLPILLLTACLAWAARAQPAGASGSGGRRALAVGFLAEGSDFTNAPLLMERLRRDLLAQPKVVGALADAGFAPELDLSPCDGPRDMVQRMNADEFDLVFTTAVVYASQSGDYGEPILMTARPGDIRQPRETGVLRRGVVFAGPASPLFSQANPTPEAIRAAISAEPLAVPSADSAAGYIYPLLTFHQKLGTLGSGRTWFCGNDAEVVKNVVAGLAQIGACREGELAALLPDAPEGKYYRVLLRTDLFPTDPILLRRGLSPEASALGRELKIALKRFFQSSAEAPRNLAVENASGRSYEKLARDLAVFREVRRRPVTAEPAPTANPTPAPALPTAATSRTATPAVTPAMPTTEPAPTATPRPVPALPGALAPAAEARQ